MNGKKVQDSDYESVRELANHCKKEGVNLGDLISALRIKNPIKQIALPQISKVTYRMHDILTNLAYVDFLQKEPQCRR